MFFPHKPILSTLFLVILLGIPRASHALTNIALAITSFFASDCTVAGSIISVGIAGAYQGSDNDVGTLDYGGLVVYDGLGRPIAHDLWTILGSTPLYVGPYALPFVLTAAPQARPFTLKFYDTTTSANNVPAFEAGDLEASVTFDPVSFGYCAHLPLIIPLSPRSAEPQPAFSDGRINNWDTGNPVVVYGHEDERGRGLVVYSPEGALLLLVSAEQIAAIDECPNENTLIASAGAIALYRLSDCRYQLNAPSLDGTKTYVLIFNELYENTGYTSYEE